MSTSRKVLMSNALPTLAASTVVETMLKCNDFLGVTKFALIVYNNT